MKVQDKGSNPLDDYCTFPVNIQDINDNDPSFGTSDYTGRVLKSAPVGTKVLTIKATDKDLGSNADIQYSLIDNPNSLFRINADTGDIEVSGSLQATVSTRLPVNLTIMLLLLNTVHENVGPEKF